jgi:hypothetical protein
MPRQHRNKRGRYASLAKKAERMAGLAIILAVLLHHAHDATGQQLQRLEEVSRQYVELQVRAGELERSAALASNALDVKEWERQIKLDKMINLYDFFAHYAPASDNNNPRAYAESVAKKMHIDPTKPVSKTLAHRIPEFAEHIAAHEGFYSDDTISRTHNNPGNLKYIGQKGATVGKLGFAKFARLPDGWSALHRQIARDLVREK